jgi:protein-tyrosine-phosphatase
MKVLFVCRGNVGRSQIAAELFSKYSGEKASSAGTKVFDREGQKLKSLPLAEPVIRFMKEEGIDVSENVRTQVTFEMIQDFDKVIVMAEPETIPDYLSNSEKFVYWEIEDSKGKDDKEHKKIIEIIREKVKGLIK